MQNEHPIAYLIKALGTRAQALSTYEKECMEILLAINNWKSYLQQQEFTILTDHCTLTHLGCLRFCFEQLWLWPKAVS
jgi:hypothetical protein